MAYTRVNWQNRPSTATPVNAENLNIMDKGIADAHSQLADIAVYPCNFGAVGDGITDDTIPIQDALDYCKLNKRALIINKKHKISKIVIDTTYVFTIISQGGELVGMTTGEYTAMIEIVDCQFVRIIGDLAINGSFNKGYGCGVWVRHNVSGSSFLNFYGLYITCFKQSFKIGSLDKPNSPMSEIMLDSVHSIGCPIFMEAIGSQTGVTIVNSMFNLDTRYVDEDWAALPMCGVKSIGALVRLKTCDVMNLYSTDYPTFVLQPVSSPEFNNPFGNIYCTDCLIESVSALALIYNPDEIANPTSGVIKFSNCTGYHAHDLHDFIYADMGFKGKIEVKGCNFYSGVPRTHANIKSDDTGCQIYVDDTSFGNNFIKGLEGIVGGELHFSFRQIFRISGTNSQVLTVNVPADIIWKNPNYGPDLNRFTNHYSFVTGEFTVPSGGLDNVEIIASIVPSLAVTSADVMVKINDGIAAITRITVSGNIIQRLGHVDGGSRIKISVVAYGESGTMNTDAYDTLSISASH